MCADWQDSIYQRINSKLFQVRFFISSSSSSSLLLSFQRRYCFASSGELFTTLTELAHLDLSDCAYLQDIPSVKSKTTISKSIFIVSSCSNHLQQIGLCSQLSTLLLGRCAKLLVLPKSIASLPLLTAGDWSCYVFQFCFVLFLKKTLLFLFNFKNTSIDRFAERGGTTSSRPINKVNNFSFF